MSTYNVILQKPNNKIFIKKIDCDIDLALYIHTCVDYLSNYKIVAVINTADSLSIENEKKD